MGVGKNVCKVSDHYDDEKAECQYGCRPQFPKDDINPVHLYRVLYALEVGIFDRGILTISDSFLADFQYCQKSDFEKFVEVCPGAFCSRFPFGVCPCCIAGKIWGVVL
jgi:hypothetical protein